eukprot:767141-Hanusia_phi.AAC.5
MASLSLDASTDEMRSNTVSSALRERASQLIFAFASRTLRRRRPIRKLSRQGCKGSQCGRVPSASESGAMHSSNSKATEARRPYRCSKCGAEKKGHLCSAKVTVNTAPPPPVKRGDLAARLAARLQGQSEGGSPNGSQSQSEVTATCCITCCC